jgi:hypothetical protein
MRLLVHHSTVEIPTKDVNVNHSRDVARAVLLDNAHLLTYMGPVNDRPNKLPAQLEIERHVVIPVDSTGNGPEVMTQPVLTIHGDSAEQAARLLGIHPSQLPDGETVNLVDAVIRVDDGRAA